MSQKLTPDHLRSMLVKSKSYNNTKHVNSFCLMANEELPDFAHNFRRNHHKLDMVIDDQIVQLYKTYAENIIQLDRLSKSFSDYNVKKKEWSSAIGQNDRLSKKILQMEQQLPKEKPHEQKDEDINFEEVLEKIYKGHEKPKRLLSRLQKL